MEWNRHMKSGSDSSHQLETVNYWSHQTRSSCSSRTWVYWAEPGPLLLLRGLKEQFTQRWTFSHYLHKVRRSFIVFKTVLELRRKQRIEQPIIINDSALIRPHTGCQSSDDWWTLDGSVRSKCLAVQSLNPTGLLKTSVWCWCEM